MRAVCAQPAEPGQHVLPSSPAPRALSSQTSKPAPLLPLSPPAPNHSHPLLSHSSLFSSSFHFFPEQYLAHNYNQCIEVLTITIIIIIIISVPVSLSRWTCFPTDFTSPPLPVLGHRYLEISVEVMLFSRSFLMLGVRRLVLPQMRAPMAEAVSSAFK